MSSTSSSKLPSSGRLIFFRSRWTWRTLLTNEGKKAPFAIYEGRAAFSLTALMKAHFPRLFGKRVEK